MKAHRIILSVIFFLGIFTFLAANFPRSTDKDTTQVEQQSTSTAPQLYLCSVITEYAQWENVSHVHTFTDKYITFLTTDGRSVSVVGPYTIINTPAK